MRTHYVKLSTMNFYIHYVNSISKSFGNKAT